MLKSHDEELSALRQSHSAAIVAPLRLALCRVYKAQPMECGLFVALQDEVMEECYAVDMLTMTCKLVACMPQGLCSGKMYFAPFHNISKAF
jgi:hypothetical protein